MIPRSQILLLVADNWGQQGPINGIALFKGEKLLYELIWLGTSNNGQPVGRYLLARLTAPQQRYEEWRGWYRCLLALDAVPEVDPYVTVMWLNPEHYLPREDLQGILPTREEIYEAWLRVEATALHDYEALLRVDNSSLAEHITIENINEEKALIQRMAEMTSVVLDVPDESIVGWFEQPPITLPDDLDD